MSSDWTPNAADDGAGDSDLRATEALLVELDAEDLELAPVPHAVWAGIEHQLADRPAPATAGEPTDVVSLAGRRRRAWTLLAAAAAVVAIVGAGVVVLGGGSDTDVVSTAALTFDPEAFDPRGAEATARAELVEADGGLEIRLTDASLPNVAGEDLQLWLIEPDASGQPIDVASVALLDGGRTYRVPEGLDPSSHFVVDISIEPRDGDPAHSGKSILRGALQATGGA
jgi:anti-sigma-K factor RskA